MYYVQSYSNLKDTKRVLVNLLKLDVDMHGVITATAPKNYGWASEEGEECNKAFAVKFLDTDYHGVHSLKPLRKEKPPMHGGKEPRVGGNVKPHAYGGKGPRRVGGKEKAPSSSEEEGLSEEGSSEEGDVPDTEPVVIESRGGKKYSLAQKTALRESFPMMQTRKRKTQIKVLDWLRSIGKPNQLPKPVGFTSKSGRRFIGECRLYIRKGSPNGRNGYGFTWCAYILPCTYISPCKSNLPSSFPPCKVLPTVLHLLVCRAFMPLNSTAQSLFLRYVAEGKITKSSTDLQRQCSGLVPYRHDCNVGAPPFHSEGRMSCAHAAAVNSTAMSLNALGIAYEEPSQVSIVVCPSYCII